jgi:hypothetical protein
VSAKTWQANAGGAAVWVEPPQLKCTAWTPPPPGLKLEGGSLTGEAAKYPGTYRLVVGKLVNGRPAYQHTSDATRWIAFAGDRWMGQLESVLGEKKGFLDLADSAAASPDVSAKTWQANAGGAAAWVEQPQLKCTAWTPPLSAAEKAAAEKAGAIKASNPAAGSRPLVGQSVRIVGGVHRLGETGTLIEDDGSGVPFMVEFSDSETRWFVAEKVALAGEPSTMTALEQGMLCRITAVPERELCSGIVAGDTVRILSIDWGAYQIQRDMPDKADTIAYCSAGLLVPLGGPPSFEVLSSKSQTEEGGCVLRGEGAGAGAAFNIAAAGGTGVWSFKIIHTASLSGVYRYVGVASESFSAAHGGAAYFFDLGDGSICSIKNAHECFTGPDSGKVLLKTSDALKGKTDGALIDMRVREDGGKRYVGFRANGGGWNDVVADGLPAVVRSYARCHDGEDRIRLEKAPAIQAVVIDGIPGRGWDFITDNSFGMLRHHETGHAVALITGSNGWLRIRKGDTAPEMIDWSDGSTNTQELHGEERRLLGTLMTSPGAHPLSKWLGSTSKFGPWKFTIADGGLVLLHHERGNESPAHTRCLAAYGYERPRSAHELSEIVAKHATSQRKMADGKAAAEKAAAEKAAAEKAAAEKAAAEKAAAAKRAADEKAATEKAAAEKAAAEKAAAERAAAERAAAEKAAAAKREADEKAAAEKVAAEKAAAERAAAQKAAAEKAATEPAFEPAAQLEGLKAGLFQLLYQWGLRSDAPAAGSAPPERRASRSQLPERMTLLLTCCVY